MGSKTKIDWCDATWSPVTGCLHGCEYCYAQRIAKRFGNHQQPIFREYPILHEPVRCTDTYQYMREAGISAGAIQPYPFDFTPTFHKYRLDEPQKWKKPKTIFVCSMADLFGDWVPDEWIKEVFDACKKAPQHRYLFLTKNPKRYSRLFTIKDIPFLEMAYFGFTIDRAHDSTWYQERDLYPNTWLEDTFISIEPLTEPLGEDDYAAIEKTAWVIIGAETGNRKGKVIPDKKWVTDIVTFCKNRHKRNIPVFMKESLRDLMGDDFRQEFPWEV